jgi:hypothetical protein
MTHLAVQAQILRTYAGVARAAVAPTLTQGGASAEVIQLLLSLADATAQCAEATVECAENMAWTRAQREKLSRMMGIARVPPKLRLVDDGQR